MRAALFRSFGPPSVLQVESGIPVPPPFGPATAPTNAAAAAPLPPPPKAKPPPAGAAVALVKVAYASVNPIDWKTRKGEFPRVGVAIPKIVGGDLSGTVVALSAAAEQQAAASPDALRVGDRVFSLTGLQEPWQGYGATAEYVAVPLSHLARVPPGVPLRAAGAVPLAGMTAWQALAPAMPLAGKRVLVHAAAGGVGGFAVQIAKAQNAAAVHGTCGPRNAEFLTKELGADGAIDYTKGPFEDDPLAAEGYDVVVDLIGGDYERRSAALLRRRAELRREAWARQAAEAGGEGEAGALAPFASRPYLAEVLNSGALREAGGNQLKGALLMLGNVARGMAMSFFDKRASPLYKPIVVRPHARSGGLEALAGLMAEGKLRVFVEREFPLEEVAAAHELVEGGHCRGKVVVRVGGGE